MSLPEITADLKAASDAQRMAADAMREHQAACIRRDWDGARVAHERVMAATEAFLDHFASAHKRG